MVLLRTEYPTMSNQSGKHTLNPLARETTRALGAGSFDRTVQDHLGKQLRLAYAPKGEDPQELPSKLRELVGILDELRSKPR